jgi:hypothetical protein
MRALRTKGEHHIFFIPLRMMLGLSLPDERIVARRQKSTCLRISNRSSRLSFRYATDMVRGPQIQMSAGTIEGEEP